MPRPNPTMRRPANAYPSQTMPSMAGLSVVQLCAIGLDAADVGIAAGLGVTKPCVVGIGVHA